MLSLKGRRPRKTKKIFLAKMRFVYYPKYRKEFKITRSCSTLLIFSLLIFAIQSNVLADPAFLKTSHLEEAGSGTKEKSAQDLRLKGYEAQEKGNYQEALSYYVKASSLGSNPRPSKI